MDRPPLQDIDIDAALRTILEGTATETGEQFFRALVRNLAAVLNTHGAWVTEYFPESRRLKALAFWMGEQWLEGWEMVVDGTPCERVIDQRCLIHIPDNLLNIYWDDPDVKAVGAASYMGMPLLDNANFERLAATCAELGRYEFMLTVAPLVVLGGTGSPVNPIATF